MTFSVIIATLGRPHILRRTIENVARSDPAPVELIVVDGDEARSSEDATHGITVFPIRYLTSPPGLPKQRNVGIDAAQGDVVVFLDDDVEVPVNTFAVLGRVFDDPGIVGATARIVEPASDRIGKKHSPARKALPGGGREGGFTRFGYPHRLVDLETERDIEFMHGSFMSVRREVASDVRFDENLPGYALAEDEDFSYRLSRRGRIRFVPELHVMHAKEGHGSRDARAFGRTLVVNRAYLFRKNFARTPLARLQFCMLIAMFMGHRLLNREFAEFRGLIEGSVQARKRPLEGRRSAPSGPPRVAFVSSHARAGGSEAYLSRLLVGLPTRVVGDVIALEQGPLVEELVGAGRTVRVIPTGGSIRSIVRRSLSLRKTLRSVDADVVHANGVKAGLMCALARTKIPFVWVKHDFSSDGLLTRFVAARARAIVGVSSAVLGSLTEEQRRSAHVVYTGIGPEVVDREGSRAKLSDELGADEGDLMIGIVGRMHPVKGHEDFIAAARMVASETDRVRFVFVGGDDPSFPDHAAEVRRAAEALGTKTHFLGHRSDVADVIAGLDIGVMTSHRDGASNVEALPLTALEMMAAGTPVVAYASGGIPELLRDCGVVVPTGDSGALAASLVRLIEDPDERRRLAECGRTRTHRYFTIEKMVEQMLEVYSAASGR
jgi:glycosyltransferase involved in cell wall biosynthesis/GT2 family glycosyltransferase